MKMMNAHRILSLTIALLSAGMGYTQELEVHEVPLTELPAVCTEAIDRELYGDFTSTQVIRFDMNDDGLSELLVWDGTIGTGGQGWNLFTQRANEWRPTGSVFGMPTLVKSADKQELLVLSPCGWQQCTFTYYELKNADLIPIRKIGVTYAPPEDHILRTQPIAVTWRAVEVF